MIILKIGFGSQHEYRLYTILGEHYFNLFLFHDPLSDVEYYVANFNFVDFFLKRTML